MEYIVVTKEGNNKKFYLQGSITINSHNSKDVMLRRIKKIISEIENPISIDDNKNMLTRRKSKAMKFSTELAYEEIDIFTTNNINKEIKMSVERNV